MVVVVKLSLIYGETPEVDNAFQLYIHNTKNIIFNKKEV